MTIASARFDVCKAGLLNCTSYNCDRAVHCDLSTCQTSRITSDQGEPRGGSITGTQSLLSPIWILCLASAPLAGSFSAQLTAALTRNNYTTLALTQITLTQHNSKCEAQHSYHQSPFKVNPMATCMIVTHLNICTYTYNYS